MHKPQSASATLALVAAGIVIVGLLAVITYWAITSKEQFANQADKDAQLARWFAQNPDGRYAAFRKTFTGADIVDFEQMRTKNSTI